MNYCFHANISIDDFLRWYMQKCNDELKLNYKARIYNSNYMNRFKVVDKYNMLSMLSVYYPDLRKYRQLEK